jgi:hypothetical protein
LSCGQGFAPGFRGPDLTGLSLALDHGQKCGADVEALIRVCFHFDLFNVALSLAWFLADRSAWRTYQAVGRGFVSGRFYIDGVRRLFSPKQQVTLC